MDKKVQEKKVTIGRVVAIPDEKTVIVSVTHEHRHPLYKKAIKRMKRYAVHNELSGLIKGDNVSFLETRPISKRKRHTVLAKQG